MDSGTLFPFPFSKGALGGINFAATFNSPLMDSVCLSLIGFALHTSSRARSYKNFARRALRASPIVVIGVGWPVTFTRSNGGGKSIFRCTKTSRPLGSKLRPEIDSAQFTFIEFAQAIQIRYPNMSRDDAARAIHYCCHLA